jgi:hypothetical protein
MSYEVLYRKGRPPGDMAAFREPRKRFTAHDGKQISFFHVPAGKNIKQFIKSNH